MHLSQETTSLAAFKTKNGRSLQTRLRFFIMKNRLRNQIWKAFPLILADRLSIKRCRLLNHSPLSVKLAVSIQARLAITWCERQDAQMVVSLIALFLSRSTNRLQAIKDYNAPE